MHAPVALRRGRHRRVDYDRVRALAKLGWTYEQIGADQACHPGYARLLVKGEVGSHTRHARKAPRPLMGKASKGMPAFDHPAINGGRTLYPSTVIRPAENIRLLKSGFNSAKIGQRIEKGKWKGFEVYTLTLEERATCPTSCRHWRSCFGSNMPQAQRFVHGEALERKLVTEIAALWKKHPCGFAIRLHVLGDFYSVRYVNLWRILIEDCPALHAFGFTARWDDCDPIAKAIRELVRDHWDRFAIRFSNAPVEECSTISIEHPYQKPDDAIICPAQLGKTQCCSSCALCWQSTKRIAFIHH